MLIFFKDLREWLLFLLFLPCSRDLVSPRRELYRDLVPKFLHLLLQLSWLLPRECRLIAYLWWLAGFAFVGPLRL